jgi:hypothetical protein
MGRLGEIRLGASEDAQSCNHDAGHEGYDHDLSVRRAIRRVN